MAWSTRMFASGWNISLVLIGCPSIGSRLVLSGNLAPALQSASLGQMTDLWPTDIGHQNQQKESKSQASADLRTTQSKRKLSPWCGQDSYSVASPSYSLSLDSRGLTEHFISAIWCLPELSEDKMYFSGRNQFKIEIWTFPHTKVIFAGGGEFWRVIRTGELEHIDCLVPVKVIFFACFFAWSFVISGLLQSVACPGLEFPACICLREQELFQEKQKIPPSEWDGS